MRNWIVVAALSVVLGVVLLVGTAQSEDDDADQAARMAPLMKIIQPGEQRAALKCFLGTWDVSISMKMPGMAEMPPTKGEATFEWANQGRWLMERLQGTQDTPLLERGPQAAARPHPIAPSAMDGARFMSKSG